MGETVAEVVAKVRVDNRDFKREMKRNDETIEQSARTDRKAARESRENVDSSVAGLGKLRLGVLGVGAAVAGFTSLLSRSPTYQAGSTITGLALDRIGEGLFTGLGLDTAQGATNEALFSLGDTIDRANKAGDGNLVEGIIRGGAFPSREEVRESVAQGTSGWEWLLNLNPLYSPPQIVVNVAGGADDDLTRAVNEAYERRAITNTTGGFT